MSVIGKIVDIRNEGALLKYGVVVKAQQLQQAGYVPENSRDDYYDDYTDTSRRDDYHDDYRGEARR